MAVDTEATAVATVATDTARGLLMLRPSPATAMAATAMAGATVAMVATDTTARGLLMLRLSPDTATAATAVDMAAMVVATDMAVATDTTARGLLMPSPRLRPRLSLAMATTDVATAMVVTVAVM